jgi:hypothetical protein
LRSRLKEEEWRNRFTTGSSWPPTPTTKNTLYAGCLLRLALEAGYATAWQLVGPQANLVLRRVLNLECPAGRIAFMVMDNSLLFPPVVRE